MKTVPALIACVLPLLPMLAGCVRPSPVIPDDRVPHRVAADACVDVWLRGQDGKLVRQRVVLREGWWIASPRVVDP